jgi:hypothetical protein
MIPCEGGGHVTPHGVCQMCGRLWVGRGEMVPPHDRQDIIAMLNRGDFDTEGTPDA